MKRIAFAALLLAANANTAGAQAAPAGGQAPTGGPAPRAALQITPEALQHIETARAAAGQQHLAVFSLICPATPNSPTREAMEAAVPSSLPSRDTARTWYTEPVKVFDDLYFVGQTQFSAWALNTSDGIVLFDAIFDYSVEAEVVDGLKKLGLNPADIKYVVIAHGHGDHVAGAKFLQDNFGAKIVMGEADWQLVESGTNAWKPRRDIVATDGMEIRLGNTTVKLVHTPGHTPGTFSSIFPVRDNGQQHMAALWGGTMFNVPNRPDSPREYWLNQYSESAQKFREAARANNVDVLVSNHTRFDASTVKMPALARRQPGQPHPFVIGTDEVGKFLTMAGNCAQAARVAEAAGAAAAAATAR